MQIQYMTWDADLFLFGIRSTRLLITRTWLELVLDSA